MDCKDISELLAAYLDNELTPEEGEQVRSHLSTCPHCREELEAIAAAQDQLRRALKAVAGQATPSPQAWVGFKQRLAVEERPRVTIWGLAKSKLEGGKDTVIRSLGSRQPVWKTAIAGVLVVALIAGLSLGILLHDGQSAEALAAGIAEKDQQVQLALGGGEVKVLKVVRIVDDKGTVICEGEMGQLVTAEVDLEAEKVIEVVSLSELTEEDKERAISIAKADPRVQDILAQGATIYKVTPMFHFGARVTEAGEVEEFSGALALVAIAFDPSDVHGKSWAVLVDLDEEKVVDIITKEPAQTKSDLEGKWKMDYFDMEEGPVEEPVFNIHIGDGGIEKGTQ